MADGNEDGKNEAYRSKIASETEGKRSRIPEHVDQSQDNGQCYFSGLSNLLFSRAPILFHSIF